MGRDDGAGPGCFDRSSCSGDVCREAGEGQFDGDSRCAEHRKLGDDWLPKQHNVKLRLIAKQVSKDLPELSRVNRLARRHAIDGLMLTAHQRIAHVAAR
jgi:hypothetical protein